MEELSPAYRQSKLISDLWFPSGAGDIVLDVPGKESFKLPQSFIESLPVAIPGPVAERLAKISQLTMKDLWIGLGTVKSNRWDHSVGAYNVGVAWLEYLHEDNRISADVFDPKVHSFESLRNSTGMALLLHDYGHLFFAHLLEEALESINWVPDSQRGLESWPLSEALGETDSSLRFYVDRVAPNAPTGLGSRLVVSLIDGTSGMRWLDSIVNSPVDADKIDYMCRDQRMLIEAGWPLTTRLNLEKPFPWLEEFMSSQYVNHAGFLCLPGRSGVAAVDLWRERILLYDRFYLSPIIRTADRVVLELLTQFIIRCAMSPTFRSHAISKANDELRRMGIPEHLENTHMQTLDEAMRASTVPVELRSIKFGVVRRTLESMFLVSGESSNRDWDFLKIIADTLLTWKPLAIGWKALVTEFWNDLVKLHDTRPGDVKLRLSDYYRRHLVGQPLEYPRAMTDEVRRITRSLQHEFRFDVLIDVAVLPKVLSGPSLSVKGVQASMEGFGGILVPKGPTSTWNMGSNDLEPLTDSKVADLDRPYGRVVVIAPDASAARARYAFDRVVAQMRSGGIPLDEVEP